MQSETPPTSSTPNVTRGITLVFEPGTPIAAVADRVQSLDLPLMPKVKFASEYALTEVTFNALRVSQERGVPEPVVAEIVDDGEQVKVQVDDGAGGFDLGKLPYDFNASPDEVEVTSDAFDDYRADHDNRRFGLGLLTTRSMVKDFSLTFIDAAGNEASWRGEGSVHGTRIQFRLERATDDKERRCSPRRVMTGRAALPDGLKAHVCDLSTGGARLIFSSKPLPLLDEIYRAVVMLEDDEPIETEVWAKIARVERVADCYDVGAQFVEVNEKTRGDLAYMIERIEASIRPDSLDKVHMELTSEEGGDGAT